MILLACRCSPERNIHYQTPMLGAFAVEFNADAAGGMGRYAHFRRFLAGTIFLVPLGDRFDKRRLILGSSRR